MNFGTLHRNKLDPNQQKLCRKEYVRLLCNFLSNTQVNQDKREAVGPCFIHFRTTTLTVNWSYMNKRVLAQYLNFHAEIQSLRTAHKAASVAGPVLSLLSISKGCRVSKYPVFQLSDEVWDTSVFRKSFFSALATDSFCQEQLLDWYFLNYIHGL